MKSRPKLRGLKCFPKPRNVIAEKCSVRDQKLLLLVDVYFDGVVRSEVPT